MKMQRAIKPQLKSLKPSMREKKRYLLIKNEHNENVELLLKHAITSLYGSIGLSKASPETVKRTQNHVIISINREAVNMTRASIALMPKELRIERVSGTIKGLGK